MIPTYSPAFFPGSFFFSLSLISSRCTLANVNVHQIDQRRILFLLLSLFPLRHPISLCHQPRT